MGRLLDARVTLIAADGRVVGDSAETAEAVAAMENHATRPEVVDARALGVGRSRRRSDTLKIDMLYVAVPVQNREVAFVRLAMPLTTIRQQLQPIVNVTLVALGLALVGASLIAWVISGRIGRRVHRIAAVARRYRAGDLRPPLLGYGDDELGMVARALDGSVQELGRRLAEQAHDRAQMEAILAGMIEGVIVVDPQGGLQLANDAAHRMLRLDGLALGRHYVETIRHPAIAALVATALAGRVPAGLELSPPRDPSRTIVARAAPVASNGAHGAVLVLHDITDLRRADRIRRDFVANVSHELRTPLTAIRGYVEALSEGDIGAAERQRFLDIVARHTLRMERLVKDLLRLARLDAGQETLDVAPFDVRGLVHSVVGDLDLDTRRAPPARRRDDRRRRRDAARRHREAPRRPAQSDHQCRHLRAGRVDHRRGSVEGRRSRRHHGVGRRARNSRRGPLARVRALLPRGQVAGARPGRHGSGALDREAPRRAARRRSTSRQPRRRRGEVHHYIAARGNSRFTSHNLQRELVSLCEL